MPVSQEAEFQMHYNHRESDPLRIRARKVIAQSLELVRQSNALQIATAAMLERFDETIERKDYYLPETQSFAPGNPHSLLDWAVRAALRITNADKANIQLLTSHGALEIVAQSGFSQEFLDYFACVHEGESACGNALKNHERVIVEDVTESAVFHHTTALEVLLDANVRAVQSTPLIDSSGRILGVLSTHWSSPCRLSGQDFRQVELLARTVVNSLVSNDREAALYLRLEQ